MLGMVIPLSKVVRYIYMEMTVEMCYHGGTK